MFAKPSDGRVYPQPRFNPGVPQRPHSDVRVRAENSPGPEKPDARTRHNERQRAKRRRRMGVGDDLWQQMLDECDGECPLCGQVFDEAEGPMSRPVIDRSDALEAMGHTPARAARGLLCKGCSMRLHQAGDAQDLGCMLMYVLSKEAADPDLAENAKALADEIVQALMSVRAG